jgi:hypothetical protein
MLSMLPVGELAGKPLMTDEARNYKEVGREYVSHESVNHGAYDYARGDVTTNTAEGYCMKGV